MKCWKIFALVASSAFLFAGCAGGGETIVSTVSTGVTSGSSAVADNSAQSCRGCHSAEYTNWTGSVHGDSQKNGPELAGDVGHSPAEQIADEDCISCHSPTAVLANAGMTEAEALGNFYTTAAKSGVTDKGKSYDAGDFYPGTVNKNSSDWPNISCLACHDKNQSMTPHPVMSLSLFDSHYVDSKTGVQGVEKPVRFPSVLCGQCHGSLHPKNQGSDDSFSGGPFNKWARWAASNQKASGHWKGTNHLLFDGWKFSKHGNTQLDPADELVEERSGQTPDEVVSGSDAESCIACHAPTAVEANGGMTEAQALKYFFKTNSSGKFDANTVAMHTDEWPNVDCTACHDPHNPGKLSYFNSSTNTRVAVNSPEELCGQCHGSLRFADTDHRSYDIVQGSGGMGVPDQKTMPGATCTDCHMYVDSTTWPGEHHFNQYMTHGHTWNVIVNGGDKSHHPENHPGWTGWSPGALAGDDSDHGDGTGNGDAPHMASCTSCHSYMDATVSRAKIKQWKDDFSALDATVGQTVKAATAAMAGNTDSALQAKLKEAQFNLNYANEDESGGFHNHNYLMSLLRDAGLRAQETLDALR